MVENRTEVAHWGRLVAACVSTVLCLESPGCGGRTELGSSEDQSDAGASGGVYGGFDGGSGASRGGTSGAGASHVGTGGIRKKPPPPGWCGNGHRDANEDCDGTDLQGMTCSALTMGAYPAGTLSCTPKCTFDSTQCLHSNGFGGSSGTGGFRGTGGSPMANACYDANGVPTQGTGGGPGCAFGYAADEICLGRTSPPAPSEGCAQLCACKSCPGSYVRCMVDGSCGNLLSCALQNGCSSMADCYKMGCSTWIDYGGGLGSASVMAADSALSCFRQNCSYPCGGLL